MGKDGNKTSSAVVTAGSAADSCIHFDFSKEECIQNYSSAFNRIRFTRLLNSLQPAAKNEIITKIGFNEADTLKCFKCHKKEHEVSGPIYSCLNCNICGCWSGDFHLKAHLNELHPLAIEIGSGTVYCGLCRKYIWNASMELFLKCPEALEKISKPPLNDSVSSRTVSPTKKKKSSSTPSAHVVQVSSENTNNNDSDSNFVKKHCISMRGLVNMGNTCFMASVLQVLLHCDKLRDFFLSFSHNSKTCNRKKVAGNNCMACELDDLFNMNYCGNDEPFSPVQFLYAMWRNSKNLSGYEQQDAHEFLISLLNQLHTDLGGSHFACNCPVHSSFTGVLQSDVTCLSCGTVNASFDPFLDISLDILTSATDSNFILDPNTSSLTLHECFQLFTHAEKLSSNTYMCSTCNHTYQEATKQLSIRKAPEILTIHLKRFEHTMNTVKIDTFIQFPLEFSLFDYTTEGVHLLNEVGRISSTTGNTSMNHNHASSISPSVIDPLYSTKKYEKDVVYKLFATVNHTGVVDSGHYISYVSNSDLDGLNSWFKFDDALVTTVPTSTVLNSNAYMLFYAKIADPIGSFDENVTIE